MPFVAIATLMAAMGITGTPFFNGSISKYFIVYGASPIVNAAIIFINLGTIMSFIKYSSMLFGQPGESHQGPAKVDICKQIATLTLGTLCLVGGIFGEQFIRFLFDISVRVDAAGYLEKSLFFAGSFVAGFLIFIFYIKKSKLLAKIREIEMGFREVCILMGVFFAVMILVI